MSSLRDPHYRAFAGQLQERVQAGAMPIDGQEKRNPTFWIETVRLGSGWAAVMVWDGMGYAEPWETGLGRYGEPEAAHAEAQGWAAAEGIECRPLSLAGEG